MPSQVKMNMKLMFLIIILSNIMALEIVIQNEANLYFLSNKLFKSIHPSPVSEFLNFEFQ